MTPTEPRRRPFNIAAAMLALGSQPIQLSRLRLRLVDKAKANTPPKLTEAEAETPDAYIRPVPPKDLATRLRQRRIARGGKARRG